MKNTPVLTADYVGSPKFILSGEDDIDDQDLLEEIFISLDEKFMLVHIDNGKKIIEYLDQLPNDKLPCLIILDYNMPELNGSEILKLIRNNNRYDSIPKVVWSTSGSTAYKTSCLELGARDYLVKPSDMKSMVETVKYMISFCR